MGASCVEFIGYSNAVKCVICFRTDTHQMLTDNVILTLIQPHDGLRDVMRALRI